MAGGGREARSLLLAGRARSFAARRRGRARERPRVRLLDRRDQARTRRRVGRRGRRGSPRTLRASRRPAALRPRRRGVGGTGATPARRPRSASRTGRRRRGALGRPRPVLGPADGGREVLGVPTRGVAGAGNGLGRGAPARAPARSGATAVGSGDRPRGPVGRRRSGVHSAGPCRTRRGAVEVRAGRAGAAGLGIFPTRLAWGGGDARRLLRGGGRSALRRAARSRLASRLPRAWGETPGLGLHARARPARGRAVRRSVGGGLGGGRTDAFLGLPRARVRRRSAREPGVPRGAERRRRPSPPPPGAPDARPSRRTLRPGHRLLSPRGRASGSRDDRRGTALVGGRGRGRLHRPSSRGRRPRALERAQAPRRRRVPVGTARPPVRHARLRARRGPGRRPLHRPSRPSGLSGGVLPAGGPRRA